MMKTPTEFQLEHMGEVYDPAKAHEYYLRNRDLKGRKKGATPPPPSNKGTAPPPPPNKARSNDAGMAKAKQKHELQANIKTLELKLHNLEALIRKKEAILKKDQAQAKAKLKHPKDKPKTAADKAKAARENAKYRDKHKQELKTKAKQADAKAGGGAHKGKPDSKKPIAELKALATKAKGQLAVAKQKLAAL